MIYKNKKVTDLKIAYIGGGSRIWAWNLMNDLAACEELCGSVYLYDIDYEAAQHNEIIGNMYKYADGAKSAWEYRAVRTAKEAMEKADFVIASIMPGTFDEMESDVHTPEKYGIYQSVGDTTGPGGIIRAMRCVPMYEEIAENVKKYCPDAWVISYTNPMTICVKTLYRVFPQIKAFGCCHEVFDTQSLLIEALRNIKGIECESRSEIKVNPVGVNHFTWLTDASYRNIDLFPVYSEFADKYSETGYTENLNKNWVNDSFACSNKLKFDLFGKYGSIAAAGDRHLAEFCEGKWYLKDPETVKKWGFGLTSVEWRKNYLKGRNKLSEGYRSGTEKIKIAATGEEGVNQIKAILGLGDLVTNVNIPNIGQIPNLSIGAVVETNAVFRSDSVTPVMAGQLPAPIYPLVSRICGEQESLSDAIAERDTNKILSVFVNDPLVTCGLDDAKKLFREMCENTRQYLKMYDEGRKDSYEH